MRYFERDSDNSARIRISIRRCYYHPIFLESKMALGVIMNKLYEMARLIRKVAMYGLA